MPGKQVRDWDMYHALRDKGHSEESAARITNGVVRRRRKRRRKKEADERGNATKP